MSDVDLSAEGRARLRRWCDVGWQDDLDAGTWAAQRVIELQDALPALLDALEEMERERDEQALEGRDE